MQLIINLFLSLVIVLGGVWALLPGGFGLHNYNASHSQPFVAIATVTYWMLLLIHPYVLYKIWFGYGGVHWWIVTVILMHIIFFTIFGRDVSTSGIRP